MPVKIQSFTNSLLSQLAAALLVTLSPSLYFFIRIAPDGNSDSPQSVSSASLLWTYTLSGILGIPVSMLIQSILAYAFAVICFGSHPAAMLCLSECAKKPDEQDPARTKLRRELSRNPRYWAFVLGCTLVAAALVEESVKYVAINHALGQRQWNHLLDGSQAQGNSRAHILAGTAAGLGFATFENMAFFISATVSAMRKPKDAPTTQTDIPFPVTVLERVLLGVPGHTTTAALIGANMALASSSRVDMVQPSWFWSMAGPWAILKESVGFHGSWNAALFFLSAWEGNVGWVHPRKGPVLYAGMGIIVALQAALYMVVWERVGAVWA